MANNSNLTKAKDAKNDEFYTQLSDIEKELRHYREHFRGKTVFCNCDDPYESNFFKYFAMNFNVLGLKKLICTCYETSPISYTQVSIFEEDNYEVNQNKGKPAYKAVLTEIHDQNGDGAIDLKDVELTLRKKGVVTKLKGDGDFRSEESIELLKEADIVVTNPPFSLFREYISQLIKYDKKFLVLGNQNAISYKEIFPLLKDNILWLGNHSGHTWFGVPDDYEIPENYLTVDKKKMRSNGYMIDENGVIWRNLGNICWYTNLDHTKRHEKLTLWKKFNSIEYPKYDSFDAVNIDNVNDIPEDYYGIMGVPITYMDKYCPDQFEIIWLDGTDTSQWYGSGPAIDGKKKYRRLFIKRKDGKTDAD